MKLFDVYPLFPITPVKASGCYVWDENHTKYLDLYGGHAVISVGHSHPHYIKRLTDQLNQIGFYSNSVVVKQQAELAEKLGRLSGYEKHHLFLCNSGAEANENAFKIASFHTGRKKILAFRKSFHGRTSAAVAATDDTTILAPVNESNHFQFCGWNDAEQLRELLRKKDVAAIIIEGIQGVGGVHIPNPDFLRYAKQLCDETGTLFIADEIQSGYGRSGKFFAHQHAGIEADIVTTAKGMGNGFPVAGVIISSKIDARHGMLGTTFGGNYLACAAALAVLEIMEQENLLENATHVGNYLFEKLAEIPAVKELRGQGLMIGIELHAPCAPVRNILLNEFHIFTGSSSDKNTLRILPPLTISFTEADMFIKAFSSAMELQEAKLFAHRT